MLKLKYTLSAFRLYHFCIGALFQIAGKKEKSPVHQPGFLMTFAELVKFFDDIENGGTSEKPIF